MKKTGVVALAAFLASLAIVVPITVFASQRNNVLSTFPNNDCTNEVNGHATMHGDNFEVHENWMHGENWQSHMDENATHHHQQMNESCH